MIATFALPIAGLMSDKTSAEVIQGQSTLYKVAQEAFNFCDGVEPVMTLAFMSLPVIPKLRMTDKGLFDVEHFKFIDLCV